MDQVFFPFGLPGATAWYTTLYVLTFALHQALMHYVLAGSLVVAWATFFPGHDHVPRHQQPLPAALRDWMPFVLSATITAGVAPLLFVQILYPQQFYTANLLLSWRWMAVIPALVMVFYLLYLLKTELLWNLPQVARAIVAALVSLGVVFVGFCWTANYLLSTHETQWNEFYLTGSLPFAATLVLTRMLVWLGGSFASLAVIASWQLRGWSTGDNDAASNSHARLLAYLALAGLGVFCVSGLLALWQTEETASRIVWGKAGLPYLLLVVLGVGMQVAGWLLQLRLRFTPLLLLVVTAGWIVSLISVSALREIGRLAALDLTVLIPRHQAATQIAGLPVFLTLTVINGAIIVWCVWIVRRRKVAAR